MKILVGADPELFMRNPNSKEFVSAWNMIPGTKHDPHPVKDGGVQVDGLALEFNINPASDTEEFVHHIQSVMDQLKAMVPGYEVVAEPVADFDPAYMASQPEKALELGCDPDFNAWTGKENVKPNCGLPMRTAAGHVHIGWTDGVDITDPIHVGMCQDLVKQLDFYLGLPSLLYDNNTRRRQMYGAAGAYRPKTYGVEYRVLSNCWLRSKELMAWVHKSTNKAVTSLVEGRKLFEEVGDIQNIINTSNVEAASDLIKGLNLETPNVR